jgi:tRNA nucleotidyltransferase (CCA-adding enzyme)
MKIITTHKNTDFDGLASVIAGTILYPDSTGVIPKMVNKNVERFLSTHKTAFKIVLPNEINPDEVETLVVVDTNQWRRLDRMEKLKNRDELIIHIWDHHDQEGDIEPSWQCQEISGSTVTLLVRELQRKKISLSPLDSTVLLIGLYEDTGHLTYPSTGVEDAKAAVYLLENGADLNVATVFLNPPYEEVQKDVLFKLTENTEKFSHHGLTIGINVVELNNKVPMLSAMVNMYRKLISSDAVFAIFTNEKMTSTVIGRSGNERIDTGAIMRLLGGGGHAGAASATVKYDKFSPKEIKELIISTIKEKKTSGATIADLMSYPVTIVSENTTMKQAKEIMEDQNIRGLLVGTEDNLTGIVVLWDLKKIKQDRQWKSPIKAFMVRQVQTIPPDLDPVEAAQMMVEKNIGHLPVEHEGKIIGIITRTDILTYVYNMLPA